MTQTLTGHTPDEITALLPGKSERYRGLQIFRWIHERGASSFEDMSNISKTLRSALADRFTVGAIRLAEVLHSADGSTDKYLWVLADGNRIESVIIRDEGRTTACISSQVGCRMGCRFCRTGGMGLVRNLTGGEIVDQLIKMRLMLRESGENFTNIVFMGMGEPLDNLEEVLRAIGIINDEVGLGIGQRKITVSTCGLLSGVHTLIGAYRKIGLAISLNAVTDEIRTGLMPVNQRWPIVDILRTIRDYHHQTGRRTTLEYILMAGINDSPNDARALANLARRHPAKVNLIAFNEYGGCDIRRPNEAVIATFRQILIDANVTAMLRKSKGADILAACGQLASKPD